MPNIIKFKILKDKPVITLDWELGVFCNFDCPYCMTSFYEPSKRQVYDFPTKYDSFFKFTDKLQSKYKEQIHLYLLGGEPILWKLIRRFLIECKERNILVTILTNGSRKISFWETILPYITRVIISYHSNFSDKEHITNLTKLAHNANIHAQVKYLVNPKTFDDDIKLAREIATQGNCMLILGMITHPNGECFEYSKEQIAYLKNNRSINTKYNKYIQKYSITCYQDNDTILRLKNLNEMFIGKYNQWKNWYCWAGITNFHIDQNQQIYGCHKKIKCIGSLNEQEIILPTKPIKCTAESCICTQDIECCKKQKEL